MVVTAGTSVTSCAGSGDATDDCATAAVAPFPSKLLFLLRFFVVPSVARGAFGIVTSLQNPKDLQASLTMGVPTKTACFYYNEFCPGFGLRPGQFPQLFATRTGMVLSI